MLLLKVDRISVKERAKILDLTVATIYHWSFILNMVGIEGLLGKNHGGRCNQHRTFEEEAAFLEKLRADGEQGLILIAHTIKQRVEEELGYEVAKDYAYDLLRRQSSSSTKVP